MYYLVFMYVFFYLFVKKKAPNNSIQHKQIFQGTPQATVSYNMVGNTKALQYFQVDESSGVVSLKRSLGGDSDIRYFVSRQLVTFTHFFVRHIAITF